MIRDAVVGMELERFLHERQREARDCLACGLELTGRRRRYCSPNCRDTLLFWLGWISDILRPLRTLYATFHFTKSVLILNVLPYSCEEVSTYLYTRTVGRKPAQDIKDMVLELSEAWWDERKRTKCRRLASKYVLQKGRKDFTFPAALTPLENKGPATVRKHLTRLKVPWRNRTVSELHREIKSAYRRQALMHHPDRGGDEEVFKKISGAYEELKDWLQNPRYRTRRGIPGKWSYTGDGRKWLTPL